MKKLAALLLLALLPAPAAAGVSCSVPFTLTNGTTADATQVMANYNAIITCLGQAAHAGANSDITSITGLTTPISPVQGGSATYAGADSTGLANTQVVASVVPTNWSLTKGNNVVFKVGTGLTNTGAVTLAVSGSSAIAVVKQTSAGTVALTGNELVAGQVAIVSYDGTQYQLVNTPGVSLTSALLGNPTGSPALASPITLGTGLSFAGSVLNAVVTAQFAPNVQTFNSGSAATYTTPTAGGNLPLYLHIRMVAGGGGGAAQSTNAGGVGTDTSFAAWTAIHGSGGAFGSGAGGAGGTGGVNGTGTLITRVAGAAGMGGAGNANGNQPGGAGGNSFFGGGGTSTAGSSGGNAATNSGSGGGGGSNGNSGGGGGASEFVEFIITSPAVSYIYTVGAGGAGGAAGTQAGGNGAAGRIEVIAHWQ
jgi:hypothetical protein